MDKLDMLVDILLIWLAMNTPYDLPEYKPQFITVSQERMEKEFCDDGKKCNVSMGFGTFRGQPVILKNKTWRQEGILNEVALLHELVHFMQYLNNNNTLPKLEKCYFEAEAYTIEFDYLETVGGIILNKKVVLKEVMKEYSC